MSVNLLRKPISLFLLAAFIIFSLAALLLITAPDDVPAMKELPKARVEIVTVSARDVPIAVSAAGRLQPIKRTTLKFEITGQITQQHVEPGQRVDAGMLLLELDARDYQNAATEAGAQRELEVSAIARDRQAYKLALENLRLQEKEVARLKRLKAKSLTSQSSLDAARQQLTTLKREAATLKSSVETANARSQLKQSASERAERNLERAKLRSPWSGVVNAVMVEAGDYVTANEPVVEVVDNSQLEFVVNLRGEIARYMEIGSQVDVEVDNQQVSGEIIALQTDPDISTFTHSATIRIPSGVGYAGQMVQAIVSLPALDAAMVIPVTALHYENGRQSVMRFLGGKVTRQLIVPGPRVGDIQVVSSGLSIGDEIVSRDVASLSDGQEVELITSASNP
jgi:RND family efflux transporter MFP subunit